MADQHKPRGPVDRTIPAGDNRERLVCTDCGYIVYDNPKIVVGSVARLGAKYLLCKRAIEPRTGYWTLPAGYMELNETTEAGGMGEASEAATTGTRIDGLPAAFDTPPPTQAHLLDCAPPRAPR